MKVVLRADIERLGKRGDIVEVAPGYARNYLVPRQLAMPAARGSADQAASMRRSRDVRDASDRAAAEEVARELVSKVIRLTARSGTEGRLFGSITTADIVDAVASQAGVELDRRRLHLDEPIKALGTHLVTTRLHPDVEFPITVEVAAG